MVVDKALFWIVVLVIADVLIFSSLKAPVERGRRRKAYALAISAVVVLWVAFALVMTGSIKPI